MKKWMIAMLLLSSGMLTAQNRFQLPPLPYANNALEPVMSSETLEFHHGKHVQAYVDNLNRLIPGTPFAEASLEEMIKQADGSIFNNGAQILNHTLFFDSFAPESQAKHTPAGRLSEAIVRDFGSFESFKTAFAQSASAVFGSGWTWLAVDDSGKLHILSLSNAGNPIRDGYTPLLGFDVWEHSYYIDYRNKRADYINNLWRIVNWKVVESRFENTDR